MARALRYRVRIADDAGRQLAAYITQAPTSRRTFAGVIQIEIERQLIRMRPSLRIRCAIGVGEPTIENQLAQTGVAADPIVSELDAAAGPVAPPPRSAHLISNNPCRTRHDFTSIPSRCMDPGLIGRNTPSKPGLVVTRHDTRTRTIPRPHPPVFFRVKFFFFSFEFFDFFFSTKQSIINERASFRPLPNQGATRQSP